LNTLTSLDLERRDPEFCAKIYALAPGWFDLGRKERIAATKKKLLEIARSGGKRPRYDSTDPEERRLAIALSRYAVHPESKDEEFAKAIFTARPEWAPGYRVILMARTKEKLLKMAASRVARPDRYSTNPEEAKLGIALNNYTTKSQRQYDADFYNKLVKINPDWVDRLEQIYERVAETKKKLLEMARNGGRRPNSRSDNPEERRLGIALNVYINKLTRSYDEGFAREIYALRPDWFDPDRKAIVAATKRKLLEMARNNERRPQYKSSDSEERRLASALMTYTSIGSASYDKAFTREIRALRPDWFDNRAAALIDTRRKLLQMARNGEKRPRERSHDPEEVRLATALKRALMKDPKFKAEIQAANPGWFR
jgi:predicted protein tyrosine phosphatase